MRAVSTCRLVGLVTSTTSGLSSSAVSRSLNSRYSTPRGSGSARPARRHTSTSPRPSADQLRACRRPIEPRPTISARTCESLAFRKSLLQEHFGERQVERRVDVDRLGWLGHQARYSGTDHSTLLQDHLAASDVDDAVLPVHVVELGSWHIGATLQTERGF